MNAEISDGFGLGLSKKIQLDSQLSSISEAFVVF